MFANSSDVQSTRLLCYPKGSKSRYAPEVMKPFVRVPFEALPREPQLAHRLFSYPLMSALVKTDMGVTRVAYRQAGSGPDVLLVHGLMTTHYSFRHVFEPLSKNFRVTVVDLLGAGESSKPPIAYSPDQMSSWLIAVTETLGLHKPLWIGNSMGGFLSMVAALRYPGKISAVVNVHSPGLPTTRMKALALALCIPGADRLLQRMVSLDAERWIWRNVHYYDEGKKSREETSLYANALLSSDGVFGFYAHMRDVLSALELEKFIRELEERRALRIPFPVPLMLLYARRDPIVPSRVGMRLSELIPSAHFQWIDNVSHFPHVDDPEEFVKAVRPFLTTHSQLSSAK